MNPLQSNPPSPTLSFGHLPLPCFSLVPGGKDGTDAGTEQHSCCPGPEWGGVSFPLDSQLSAVPPLPSSCPAGPPHVVTQFPLPSLNTPSGRGKYLWRMRYIYIYIFWPDPGQVEVPGPGIEPHTTAVTQAAEVTVPDPLLAAPPGTPGEGI